MWDCEIWTKVGLSVGLFVLQHTPAMKQQS
jgi:hypothetical protein